MQGPFYASRAYMYGNTFFDPEVPYYNSTRYHKKPAPRQFPDRRQFDDDSEYKEHDPSVEDGQVVRVHVPNIINCETWMEKQLHIVFYGVTAEDDQEYTLQIGKRYAIQYITESGIKTADGYLRVFSSSIPDDNCRYANNLSDEALQSWIGMDCSTEGISDKRRIYINTIRALTPLEDGENYEPPVESFSIADLLSRIYTKVSALKNCECIPITEKILELVTELKQAGVSMEDLDLNGDGIISQDELDNDHNNNQTDDGFEFGDIDGGE